MKYKIEKCWFSNKATDFHRQTSDRFTIWQRSLAPCSAMTRCGKYHTVNIWILTCGMFCHSDGKFPFGFIELLATFVPHIFSYVYIMRFFLPTNYFEKLQCALHFDHRYSVSHIYFKKSNHAQYPQFYQWKGYRDKILDQMLLDQISKNGSKIFFGKWNEKSETFWNGTPNDIYSKYHDPDVSFRNVSASVFHYRTLRFRFFISEYSWFLVSLRNITFGHSILFPTNVNLIVFFNRL